MSDDDNIKVEVSALWRRRHNGPFAMISRGYFPCTRSTSFVLGPLVFTIQWFSKENSDRTDAYWERERRAEAHG